MLFQRLENITFTRHLSTAKVNFGTLFPKLVNPAFMYSS